MPLSPSSPLLLVFLSGITAGPRQLTTGAWRQMTEPGWGCRSLEALPWAQTQLCHPRTTVPQPENAPLQQQTSWASGHRTPWCLCLLPRSWHRSHRRGKPSTSRSPNWGSNARGLGYSFPPHQQLQHIRGWQWAPHLANLTWGSNGLWSRNIDVTWKESPQTAAMCLTDGCSGSCWAERISGQGRRAPSRFISTPPPWFITLSFNPFSLEIKVSSCPCTSFRFLAPLADYSICLPQNYLTRVPASPRCPHMTTCCLVPALPAMGP